jgi:hypothetical protein
MIYRLEDRNGDYTFGIGDGGFLANSPQTVGQAIYTRLRLQYGEMFYATQDGVPYADSIIGYQDPSDRDSIILETILDTPNVTQVVVFDSFINPTTRIYSFTATVETTYGSTTVSM